jgi:hypothetical protein
MLRETHERYVATCDRCSMASPTMRTDRVRAVQQLGHAGWAVRGDATLCPQCGVALVTSGSAAGAQV